MLKNGEASFEYHYTWRVALLFGAAAVVLLHCFVNVVHICRKDPWYKKQFQPIILGIICLFAGNLALLVPVFRGFPIDLVLGIVNALFLIYALLSKRLFQLKLLASESSCYGMGILLTFLLYYNLMPYISRPHFQQLSMARELIYTNSDFCRTCFCSPFVCWYSCGGKSLKTCLSGKKSVRQKR